MNDFRVLGGSPIKGPSLAPDPSLPQQGIKLLGFPTREPMQANDVNEDMAPYGETKWNELE